MSLFELKDVSYQYAAATRPALDRITLNVEEGALFAVLGPNGSGKSTLLRVMLGELETSAGSVTYAGRSSASWGRREIATQIAFVPQAEPMAFPMTVRSLVEMGRYPHTGILGRMGADDRIAVDGAMERAGIADLGSRSIRNLSGGERQRVRIARALAQEPRILVLDEPTAALDLHFEMETFELMRELTEERSFTVVVATHNLNLAARYASRLALLARGHIEAIGAPEDVITADKIGRVYRWPVLVTSLEEQGSGVESPQVVPLSGGAASALS
ncbi:MAG: ABC transporter ATP-binding protein [Longimicrobiales bacterium]